MFNSVEALQHKLVGRHTNQEKQLIQQIALLMMEMNISYKDMMEMPIPAFIQLGQALVDIRKMEAKLQKKGKKK